MTTTSFYTLKPSVFLYNGSYRVGFNHSLSPGSKFLVLGVRGNFVIANLNYTCFLAKRAALFLFGSLARSVHPVLVLGYIFSSNRDIFRKLSYHVVSHVRTWIPGLFTNWKVVSSTALRAEGSLQDVGMIFEFPDIMLLLGINDRMDYIVNESRVLSMPSVVAADTSLDFTRVNYYIPTNYRSFRSSNFFLRLFYSLKKESYFFRVFRYFSIFKNYVKSAYSLRNLKRNLRSVKFSGLSSFLSSSAALASPVFVPSEISTRKLFPFLGYFSHGYMSKRVSSMLFFRSILSQLFQKRRRIFILKSFIRDFRHINTRSLGYRLLKRVFEDFFFAGHQFSIRRPSRKRVKAGVGRQARLTPINRFSVLYRALSSSSGKKFCRRVVKRKKYISRLPKQALRTLAERLPEGLRAERARKTPALNLDPESRVFRNLSVFEIFERYRLLGRSFPRFSTNALLHKSIFKERPIDAPSSFTEYLDFIKFRNPPAKDPSKKSAFRVLDRHMLVHARERSDYAPIKNRFVRAHSPFLPKHEYRKLCRERMLAKRKELAELRYKQDVKEYKAAAKDSMQKGPNAKGPSFHLSESSPPVPKPSFRDGRRVGPLPSVAPRGLRDSAGGTRLPNHLGPRPTPTRSGPREGKDFGRSRKKAS